MIHKTVLRIRCLFTEDTYNFLYWLLFKLLGIIAIRSCTFQKGHKIKNFNLGDDLNLYLIESLSGRRVMNYDNMRTFRLNIKHYTCIGSVFEFKVDESTIVWGTGSMYGGSKNIAPPKKIFAVRGPLTRKVLTEKGITCPEVYGDPALLLPLVFHPIVKKQYELGIIPHFVDYELDSVKQFIESGDNKICLIRLQYYNNWKDVIKEICMCKYIVSSSLHGLIIADAYNIPNVWMKLSDNIMGGEFKYQDYFASVGRTVKEPLDFRNEVIDLSCIIDKLREYQPIHFSYAPLINACPFINNKRKRMLIDKISI